MFLHALDSIPRGDFPFFPLTQVSPIQGLLLPWSSFLLDDFIRKLWYGLFEVRGFMTEKEF